jgi:o-succinylbenzoate synthase
MRIQTLTLHSYEVPLTNGQIRSGALINITDEHGNSGWGDISPLPKWSKETLEGSLLSLNQKQHDILKIDWTARNCLNELANLKLLPAASFGLESALLSIVSPLSAYRVQTSALLMGSPKDIFEQADLRHIEGYTSAKLKVSNLSFEEAFHIINQLKDKFSLRIDVNRAWTTPDSLRFFSQFPLDTFDYVEEPFQNPNDLTQFLHPLAVDESFPEDLSLAQLEALPTLKALIYKPTIQGGMAGCISLHEWASKKGIDLVLSSSFESDLGLANVASIAHRLSLSAPVGIGTFYFLSDHICATPLQFSNSVASIPALLTPKTRFINHPPK